ncbi:MAG: SagB/ThcOx family dehydrogenase, partial [Staphylothermus sp.]|nr:SagB/ThcOx family dehydrogenase [Staphylothermus sp.]
MENLIIELPLVKPMSKLRVEEAILLRRSIRRYLDKPVEIEKLSLILWSAYGYTHPGKRFRASPSAGATFPLELYVVIGSRGVVNGEEYLEPGVYKYRADTHSLILTRKGDLRRELYMAALEQKCVFQAPLSIVITAVYERTTNYYGERGAERYVPMEVGHVGQNIYLMATSLGLGTVAVGAFHDEYVSNVIDSPE